MSQREHLLDVLRDRLAADPILADDIGPIAGLVWIERGQAIEADIKPRTLRVEHGLITLTHQVFGSAKKVPLA